MFPGAVPLLHQKFQIRIEIFFFTYTYVVFISWKNRKDVHGRENVIEGRPRGWVSFLWILIPPVCSAGCWQITQPQHSLWQNGDKGSFSALTVKMRRRGTSEWAEEFFVKVVQSVLWHSMKILCGAFPWPQHHAHSTYSRENAFNHMYVSLLLSVKYDHPGEYWLLLLQSSVSRGHFTKYCIIGRINFHSDHKVVHLKKK